jgi:hypothetical protein
VFVQRLEKEHSEKQQYADQVVNQLGHALRSLEADKASLQEEKKLAGQKISASAEARRKLERQVKQLKAVKEDLIQQVMHGPVAEEPDARKIDSLPSKKLSRSPRSSASASAPAPPSRRIASEPSSPSAMHRYLAADLATEPASVREGRGVAWQPLEGSQDVPPLEGSSSGAPCEAQSAPAEIVARRRAPHKHEVQGAPPHGIAALTSFALQVSSAGSAGSMSGSATTPTADGRLGEGVVPTSLASQASSTAGSAATGGGQSDLAGKVLATPAWAACKWSAPED